MLRSVSGGWLLARNGWSDRSTTEEGVRLCCRGGVQLFIGNEDLTPRSKKGRALLAILAAEKRPLTRTRIIDLLWSNRQEEQARASLRTLLADLREQLGSNFDEVLVADRERVGLAPSLKIDWSDASTMGVRAELFEGLDHLDPELDEWLRAERQRWDEIPPPQKISPARSKLDQMSPRLRARFFIILPLILLAITGAVLWLGSVFTQPRDPVIAVMPFRDTTGRFGLLAEGLAEDLRVHLAERGGLQVIGRLSSEATVFQSDGAQVARQTLGVTHLIEGSLLAGASVRLSIRLIATDTGKVIWNHVIPAQPNLIAAGPAPMANLIAAEVLDTVAQAGPNHAFEADPAAYRDLFQARRMLARLDSAQVPEARSLLSGVIARFPRFAPALAAYAEATIRSSDHPYYRGELPLRQARQEGERAAQLALRLAPQFALAHLALGQVRVDTPGALEPLQRAVQLAPGSYRAQYRLSGALDANGDLHGALRHARRAEQLEPLDPLAALRVGQYLQFFGEFDEIDRVRANFIARASTRFDELRVETIMSGFLGDYSRALGAARAQLAIRPDDQQAQRGLSFALVQLGLNEEAVVYAQRGSVSALVISGNEAGLLEKMNALGSEFWMLGFETDGAAEFLYARGRGTDLMDSYDRANRALSEEMAGVGPLVLALRHESRANEAELLLARYERWLSRRTRGLPVAIREALFAEYYALSGADERAMRALEQNFAVKWVWLDGNFTPMLNYAAFRRLRGRPDFLSLSRRYLRELNRERREAGIPPLNDPIGYPIEER